MDVITDECCFFKFGSKAISIQFFLKNLTGTTILCSMPLPAHTSLMRIDVLITILPAYSATSYFSKPSHELDLVKK